MSRDKKRFIINLFIIFFVCTFLISGFFIGRYYFTIYRSEKRVKDLKKLINGQIVINDENGENGDEGYEVNLVSYNNKEIQQKFLEVYKSNQDFMGWLTVDGTDIDYPVMYTPEDEEFYLRREFDKKWSVEGTPFIAGGCDPLKPTDNVIIYGHNMNTGTLFGALTKFEDESFLKKHKYVEFDTVKEDAVYEIIAVFRTEINVYDASTFRYYTYFDFENKKEFKDYVKRAKEAGTYDIETTAKYGDKLLTLSTCSYHNDRGRLVVVCKRVKVNGKNVSKE